MGKVTYSTYSTMTSIVSNDKEECFICKRLNASECHHIFEGPDKKWSEHFKLMIPLCSQCHAKLHRDQEMNEFVKRAGQEAFEKNYPGDQFTTYFRRNYK